MTGEDGSTQQTTGRTGLAHHFRLTGVAGVILGNFDRRAGTEASPAEYHKRVLRPGSILLANLDMDPRPAAHPLDPNKKKFEQLDAMDRIVSGGDDSREMATLIIRKPTSYPRTASHVILRVHPQDAKRVRVFRSGTTDQVILGDGKRAEPHERITANRDFEYELPKTADPWAFHFQIEAITLGGSRKNPPPLQGDSYQHPPQPSTATVEVTPQTVLPPSPPPPTYDVNLPSSPTTTVQPPPTRNPLFRQRLPGEVWFELLHLDRAGNPLSDPYDVALYTIAPLILLSNLEPPEVLYMCDIPMVRDPTTGEVLVNGTQESLFDVDRAVQRISGVRFHMIPENECKEDNQVDTWAQDEFQIGYCRAVHQDMHAALHCPRGKPMGKFVREVLPGPDLGLFDDLTSIGDVYVASDQNSGGNIEVSPPVDRATGPQPAGAAGPAVPAHPRAPFGKIVLGSTSVGSPIVTDFLHAQKVQPLVQFDVAWLKVGHTDEVVTFVPAPRGGSKRFRLLMASPPTAIKLLRAAIALHRQDPGRHPITSLFRGKSPTARNRARFYTGPGSVGAMTPQGLGVDMWPPQFVLDVLGDSNEMLHGSKLLHIEQRLLDTLALNPEDVLALPVLYTLPEAVDPPDSAPSPDRSQRPEAQRNRPDPLSPEWDRQLEEQMRRDRLARQRQQERLKRGAFTPNLVNMQVLGRHLLVPRPFGPCVKPEDAAQILRNALGVRTASLARLQPLKQREYWGLPGESAGYIAGLFAVQPSSSPARVSASQILSANRGKFDSNGRLSNMSRVLIPEPLVDLFEAYTQIVLEDLGLTVHWIDTWYNFHLKEGEIHCGTNVKRRMPQRSGNAPEAWWDYYAELTS